MGVKMVVTHRVISRREKTRRRFRHWWNRTTSDARLSHLMTCTGCVGCTSILDEIKTYIEVNRLER
jgi:hypothetical protein